MNKNLILNVKIYNLIKNRIHLGVNKNILNKILFCYVSYFRNNIGIINLKYFIIEINKILLILEYISYNRGYIFISLSNNKNYQLHKNVYKKGIKLKKRVSLFIKKYSPGLFTNYKTYNKMFNIELEKKK